MKTSDQATRTEPFIEKHDQHVTSIASFIGIYAATHNTEIWHKAYLMWGTGHEPKLKWAAYFKNTLSTVNIPLIKAPQASGDKLDHARRTPEAKDVGLSHPIRVLDLPGTHIKRPYQTSTKQATKPHIPIPSTRNTTGV